MSQSEEFDVSLTRFVKHVVMSSWKRPSVHKQHWARSFHILQCSWQYIRYHSTSRNIITFHTKQPLQNNVISFERKFFEDTLLIFELWRSGRILLFDIYIFCFFLCPLFAFLCLKNILELNLHSYRHKKFP